MAENAVKLIMLTDFRRGVRFVRGSFANVLPPGTYHINPVKEQISIVDMRPQPLLFERCTYRDALNNPSVISIGTDLLVEDPHLAVTKLKDHSKDAIPIINDILRATVSRLAADGSREGRKLAAKAITDAINGELRKVGLRVTLVEITELYSQEAQNLSDAMADVTQ